MKIDMSPNAVTHRLKSANQLRNLCLILARSSAGQNIRQKHTANKLVKRTFSAIGR
ncbi:MAG: hypothetical protein JXN64_06130 [Spirochaetes bacterium]|nr:hypothetical protein [Spirochaetota bacterium]